MKSNTIKIKNRSNKHLDIIVIGSGMYVLGKDKTDLGTILPTLLQEQSKGMIRKIIVVSKRVEASKKAAVKLAQINKTLKLQAKVEFLPAAKDDETCFLKAIKKYPQAAAIVCVPDHLHFQVTDQLLEHKIPTLVVKPFTTTLADALALTRKAARQKTLGAVEFHKRFDEANMLLKTYLHQGRIGDPLYFLVEYSQKRTIPLDVFKKWAQETNIFQYLAVHYVDLIYFLTSAKPIRVSATGQKNLLASHGIDTYDAIQANIEWQSKNGHQFNSLIATNWIDPNSTSSMSDQKIKLIGTKGRIESDQKNRGFQIVDEESIEDINPYFCKQYQGQTGTYIDGYGPKSIRHFLEDVRQNKITNCASFKDACVSSGVIEAVTKSLNKKSQWIDLT